MTPPFRIADHRHGPPNSRRSVRRSAKVSLLLVFDVAGDLAELTVVHRNKPPAGRRIFFNWCNGLHAFKTRQGVGGLAYTGVTSGSGGRSGGSGTVYDDDAFVNADGTPWRSTPDEPDNSRPQPLDEWISNCIELLVSA